MKRGVTMLVAALAAVAVGCQKNKQPDDAMDDRERTDEVYEEPGGEPRDDPFAMDEDPQQAIPVADIVTSPSDWSGEDIEGTARVAQVPTSRAFWIEQAGNTLLALLVKEQGEDPVQIQQGQVLRIDGATVRTPADLSQIEGDPLDADTAQLAFSQPVFLVLEAKDISILSGPGS